MTLKRFMLDDCGELIDLNNHKFIDYGEECCNLLNEQHETIERLKQNIDELMQFDVEDDLLKENEQLKKLLECSRKEANDYCEELMGKDEFIRLYKRQRDEFMEENEQLQARIEYLERKIQRERNSNIKEHKKWENEIISKNEKIKQQRDFYYARLQKIIKIANGDFE